MPIIQKFISMLAVKLPFYSGKPFIVRFPSGSRIDFETDFFGDSEGDKKIIRFYFRSSVLHRL